MPILVGYRNDSAGRDALRLGARIARTIDASIDIVTVYRVGDDAATLTPPSASYDRYVREQQRTWLDDAKASVGDGIAVDVHLETAVSEPAGILAVAHRLGADLIVVGTAGGGLLGRFSLGGVSNSLLHSSDIPVALAPDNARETPEDAALSRVSVAVGDIGGNRNMLAVGKLLSAKRDLPVRLITLAEVDRRRGEADVERVHTAAVHLLDVTTNGIDADRVHPTTVVQLAAHLGEAIREIEWDPREVVLIGSGRLAQQRRTFLGSTAAKLVRELTVPMIVIPRDETDPASIDRGARTDDERSAS